MTEIIEDEDKTQVDTIRKYLETCNNVDEDESDEMGIKRLPVQIQALRREGFVFELDKDNLSRHRPNIKITRYTVIYNPYLDFKKISINRIDHIVSAFYAPDTNEKDNLTAMLTDMITWAENKNIELSVLAKAAQAVLKEQEEQSDVSAGVVQK